MSKKNHGYRLSRRRNVFPKFQFLAFFAIFAHFRRFFCFFCLKTSSKLQIKLPGVYCNTGSHFYTSTESFFNLESTKINVFLVFFGIFRVFKRFFALKCWNLLRYLLRVKNNAVCFIFNIGSQYPKKQMEIAIFGVSRRSSWSWSAAICEVLRIFSTFFCWSKNWELGRLMWWRPAWSPNDEGSNEGMKHINHLNHLGLLAGEYFDCSADN